MSEEHHHHDHHHTPRSKRSAYISLTIQVLFVLVGIGLAIYYGFYES